MNSKELGSTKAEVVAQQRGPEAGGTGKVTWGMLSAPAWQLCRGSCGIQLGLQPVGMDEKTNAHFIHIPIVPHPRADLRGNKRPHIERLAAFKETHEHSSNSCTVFPYWKKSRGVFSVYYTFFKVSKCDPGY